MPEFIDGNHAVVRAAVDAGCNFFAGYPITPATSILLEATAALPSVGGLAIQAEDEIAAIGMCLAASMAGRKAMTATSGPGLSLYSETLGLGIMGEVPLVICNAQRMGPATGGATLSADGDVQFVRWGTSGGYPIIALAPSDVRTSYVLTRHAFNLAEQYRLPVFVMLSKEIALTRQSVTLPPAAALPRMERRPFTRVDATQAPFAPYRIGAPEEIPAFSPVGGPQPVRFTTSVHDATGVITNDPAAIDAKLHHLQAKISASAPGVAHYDLDLNETAPAPTAAMASAAASPPDLIIAYGVAAMAAKEATAALRQQQRRVHLLTLYTLWPVLTETIAQAAKGCERIFVPEHNFGQYALEVQRLVPHTKVIGINRVDGKLLTPDAIVQRVLQ